MTRPTVSGPTSDARGSSPAAAEGGGPTVVAIRVAPAIYGVAILELEVIVDAVTDEGEVRFHLVDSAGVEPWMLREIARWLQDDAGTLARVAA